METPGIEVHVQVLPSGVQAGNLTGPPLIERFTDRARELSEAISGIADELRDHLTASRQVEPSEWGLEEMKLGFSVTLEAATGVILARAATAGSFTVDLTFTRGERASR